MNNHQQPKSDTEKDEKTNRQKISSFALGILLALFAFIVAILFFWKKTDKKIYKKELYEHYIVDRKTFAHWIAVFCSDIISSEDYAKCRKLPMSIVDKIYERLGKVSDETPTFLKKNIIEAADGSYHTLRESIKRFPDEYGITPSVFQTLNTFPPKIGARILHCYQNGVR